MIDAIWHLVLSSASVSTLIGGIAVAIAVLLPKQLDFITDLRKWAIVVAVIAFGYSAVYSRGYVHGLSIKQAQWDAAVTKEVDAGEQARIDAERTVTPDSVRNDKRNRDNWP